MPAYNDTNELFQSIENIREEYGLSISNFCSYLKMSESTYYRWKRGTAPAQIDLCLSIINLLQGGIDCGAEE